MLAWLLAIRNKLDWYSDVELLVASSVVIDLCGRFEIGVSEFSASF